MSHTSRISENLGFLTVLDQPRLGLIGGYLVLNPAGRPLEFHCTTPIKPNRAQEILYGNTLEPFLYGEQVAQTLIARSKTPVNFVLTNVASVLAAQDSVDIPVLYVFETRPGGLKPVSEEENTTSLKNDLFQEPKTKIEISEQLNESLKSFGIDNTNLQPKTELQEGPIRVPDVPGLDTGRWKGVRIGNRNVALPCDRNVAWDRLVDEIKDIAASVDLAEPFTRIRLAIDEAQRAA